MTCDGSDALPQLVIIADDLTGALDAAGPFAAAGRQVRVATAPAHLQEVLTSGAEVVAVSMRSRDVPAQVARHLTAEVMARLPDGVGLFKKVDSRLKGNIAAELDAMAPDRLLVAPAIPDFGRVVKAGHVTGFGVTQPISVARLLGVHAARAEVPDCETNAEMQQALRHAGPGTLLVGARGMAQALAGQPEPLAVALDGPMTVVVGSTDPITLAQCTALRQACPDLRYLPAPAGVTDAPASPDSLVLLQAVAGEGPLDGSAVARALADSFARLRFGNGVLVLTGGATAEAVLDRLALGVLDVRGEALPGLPLIAAGDLRIITKSGGFGGAETLLDLAEMARGAVISASGGSA